MAILPISIHVSAKINNFLKGFCPGCGVLGDALTTIALHVTHHDAPHVSPHVRGLIAALQGEMSRAELMAALGLADRSHFLRAYLHPSLDAGLIEMTLPQSPRSRNQRYRLTALGGEARNSQQESEEEGITERTRRPTHGARSKTDTTPRTFYLTPVSMAHLDGAPRCDPAGGCGQLDSGL